MKRLETTEKVIGENTFYIRPFAAFTAASIGSELAALLAPILSNIFPSLHSEEAASGENNVLSADIDDVLPAIANAAAYLDGKKIERMMTRLLIENDNVSVQGAATGGSVQKLTKDLADEVFCQNLTSMLALGFEVAKLNFGGMFTQLAEKARNNAAEKETA